MTIADRIATLGKAYQHQATSWEDGNQPDLFWEWWNDCEGDFAAFETGLRTAWAAAMNQDAAATLAALNVAAAAYPGSSVTDDRLDELIRDVSVIALAERQHNPVEDDYRTNTPDQPHDGLYTVVLADGERRTLRVKRQERGNLKGRTIVSYLSGSDNDHDYTGFGFLEGGRLHVWKRFQGATVLTSAVAVLLGDPEAAAEAYALESNRCSRCNKTLTVPASIYRGRGPVCAGMVAA